MPKTRPAPPRRYPWPIAIVATEERDAAEALRAADVVGATEVRRIGWDAAGTLLAEEAPLVVMLEAGGAEEALLDEALPAAAVAAEKPDVSVIASFDVTQIDVVTAHLIGGEAQLLCDASVAERVAALMTIAVRDAVRPLTGHAREEDATGLARLTDELARITDVLARLTQRDAEPRPLSRDDVHDRQIAFDAGPSTVPAIAAAEIRDAIRARRLRDRILGEGLFEDPAWDMLLDLFAAHLEHAQVAVSSLCIASAVAPTTALRWITKLDEAGFLVRRPDPFDRRRIFLALSGRGIEAMRRYVLATRALGAPIA